MKIVVFSFLFMLVCTYVNAQTIHVIQRGETLDLIARQYKISTEAIEKANPLINEFYTGLTISIPSKFECNNMTVENGNITDIGNAFENYEDALIYDLQGKVSKCIWYYKNDSFDSGEFEERHSKEFEVNGKLRNGNGLLIKRDQKNRIIQTQNRVDYNDDFFGDFHGMLCVDYTYYVDGKIESEVSWKLEDGKSTHEYTSKVTYFYNSDGYVKKIINKDLSASGRIDLVTEYEYLSFDKYGNWTERKFEDPVNLSEEIQKRVITYY